MIATLFSLQIIIHMFLLSIPFPGNIVNVIKKLKPLVSFNIIKDLNKFIERIFMVDTAGQIEMQDLIIPSVRGMGTKQMNCIINFKHIILALLPFVS